MRLKRRGDSGGLGDGGQLAVVLLLGGLNPALDFPHGVEILGEPGAIPGSYSAPKIADAGPDRVENASVGADLGLRSEEHTSELQSHLNLVCRLLLEKKKKNNRQTHLLLASQSTTLHVPTLY